jgi:hypothetical protein
MVPVYYDIRRSLLRYSVLLHPTLRMHDAGEDVSRSPYVLAALERIKAGHPWHTTCKTVEDVLGYQNKLIGMYESIKRDGVHSGEIIVWFDNSGAVHILEGNHRLSILDYLAC